MAAMALIKATAYSGNQAWLEKAQETLGLEWANAIRYLTGFADYLCAIDVMLTGMVQLAVLTAGDDPGSLEAFAEVIWDRLRPNLVLAVSSCSPPNSSPDICMIDHCSITEPLPTSATISAVDCRSTPRERLPAAKCPIG
jgi:hypothetical protein